MNLTAPTQAPAICAGTPLDTFSAMLAEAEATGSKKEKQEIVARALNSTHGADILKLLNYALSPYIRFNIQQLPEITAVPTIGWSGNMKLIYDLLDHLSDRRISGNDARTAVSTMLALLPDHLPHAVTLREAFRRVLLKDLRAGFDTSTVNKARKNAIPVFECQLAISEMPDIGTLSYPVAVEPKFDGVRTIAIKRAGAVTLYSRNGIPFANFAEIEDALNAAMPDDFVFDGEVLHRDILGDEGFKLVMKRAKAERGKNVAGNPVRYQVFDGMTLAEWDAQKCRKLFFDRTGEVRQIVLSCFPSSRIVGVTESKTAGTPAELEAIYLAYVAEGFEGVIIKQLDGGYTFKRNKTWMKLKPFDTADLTVVGVAEGCGKYAGMLGTLVVEGEHKGLRISCEVGSGFTDGQRADWWTNQAGLIGRIVEVRYQDITLAEGSATHSLRFPTFVRFREADAAGKI